MSKHLRILLATVLVVTGSLVFLPSGYVGAGGMVSNQGFEEGVGGVPIGWNLTGNATRIDAGPVYEGDWAAQITGGNDTLTQWVDLTQWIGNITIPLAFEAWGWMYVSGNVTGIVALDFWSCAQNETCGCNSTSDNSTVQLSPTTFLSATDTEGVYAQATGALETPLCATHLRIRLLGTGWDEGGEVRFDDIGFWFPGGWGFCFVATAAYGSETAGQLNVLRAFRDQVLLKSAVGSRLVDTYYRLSPPVADFIAKNDVLRAAVRAVFLDPIVNILRWSQGLWTA
jgi:hypothetical protein